MPVPGQFLGNESHHNFASLGDQYLEAARCLCDHFQTFEWPIYQNAFQALEQYLKSYLIRRGATADHVKRRIGHNLRQAMIEAKAMGLVLNVSPQLEAAVMSVSEYYSDHEFRYCSNGQWSLVLPHMLIFFVEAVCVATGNSARSPRYARKRAGGDQK